jgi:hypothetical protein
MASNRDVFDPDGLIPDPQRVRSRIAELNRELRALRQMLRAILTMQKSAPAKKRPQPHGDPHA